MIAVASAPLGVSPQVMLLVLPYIGQFAGHGNKATDRNGLGAPGRIDMRCGSKASRFDCERPETLPQHFAALAESRGRYLLKRPAIASLRLKARHQSYDGRGDLRLRHECRRRNVEQDLCFSAPVGEHG